MPAPYSILVVEDERLIREAACDALREAGLEPLAASNGIEALASINARLPLGGLFTNIRLGPGLDGWAVAEAFREAFPGRPVAYASGYAPGEAAAVPQSVFFPKPYRIGIVSVTLMAMIGEAREREAAQRAFGMTFDPA